jgi:hypothetical protein
MELELNERAADVECDIHDYRELRFNYDSAAGERST